MKSFIEQARFYADYHHKITTRNSHFIGVPLIVLAIMILFGFVQIIVPGVFSTNLAWFLTLAALVYYLRLNWQLGLTITPIFLFLLWIADWFSADGPTTFSVWSFIIILVAGGAFQLYGHFVEGKKPALVDDLSLALIAPLYLVAELFFMAGYMQALNDQIHDMSESQEEKQG